MRQSSVGMLRLCYRRQSNFIFHPSSICCTLLFRDSELICLRRLSHVNIFLTFFDLVGRLLSFLYGVESDAFLLRVELQVDIALYLVGH